MQEIAVPGRLRRIVRRILGTVRPAPEVRGKANRREEDVELASRPQRRLCEHRAQLPSTTV